ncbi:hypothetical protein TNCV_3811951 [Trichonephila clavipes]|nr:hypothetical protein TNCV_3811951 [Trichonephila clavipes]
MIKNALKEDLIRVVEELDGTVESTDTIVKLKTKIENSSTFESDPDFVKTLIQNCIDERVSQNEREETATHIGIREAEDWFRPIDLAKECDIYISSRSGSHKRNITYGYTQDPFKNRSQNFKPKIKENYPQYLERKKNCFICGDSSHCARDLLCKKANGAMKTSSVEFISQSPTPSPMNSNYRRFSSGLHGNTAADSVQSEWPLWHAAKSNAVFARRRIELKLKLLDIRAGLEREKKERESYTRAFGDGPRNFEPWSSDVDDTPKWRKLHSKNNGRNRLDHLKLVAVKIIQTKQNVASSFHHKRSSTHKQSSPKHTHKKSEEKNAVQYCNIKSVTLRNISQSVLTLYCIIKPHSNDAYQLHQHIAEVQKKEEKKDVLVICNNYVKEAYENYAQLDYGVWTIV